MLSLIVLTLAAAPVELRQERALDFAVDEAFQNDGGVQYFYELADPVAKPTEGSPLAIFRSMDELSKPNDPYHVVMSRLVYTVDRDVSFFTEARARDAEWMNRVAPDVGVTAEADGSFRAARTPSNRFRITWLEPPFPDDAGLKRFLSLLPSGAVPVSVVVQKNSDFSRVLGMRTAERALTYTAHVPLGPGRTRVFVCSMSLLHTLPPFFLGGRKRVYVEAIEGAGKLIEQLRNAPE
jgi:hypothetical protein